MPRNANPERRRTLLTVPILEMVAVNLELRLLGRFEAVKDGAPVTDFESDSARAVLAYLASSQATMKQYGIGYAAWAILFGLIISNIFKVPQFLKAAGQTEYFIKIGLVCMGAGILFSDVLRGGFMGLVQAVLVATAVWFMTYWVCRKFQVSERFSAIIASANAICARLRLAEGLAGSNERALVNASLASSGRPASR